MAIIMTVLIHSFVCVLARPPAHGGTDETSHKYNIDTAHGIVVIVIVHVLTLIIIHIIHRSGSCSHISFSESTTCK